MTKNTKILLGVFVILLGVYFLFFRSKDRVTSDKWEERLFTADSSKIEKIEIVKTGESITLEKINNQWMVTKPVNYPADTNAITPMLANLKNFRIEGIASDKAEKFPTYLDSANHTVVTVYQEGKNLGTFEIGKSAVGPENSYVKKPNDNKILIGSNINATNFTKSLNQYRFKYVTSIQSAGIKTIQIKSTDSNKVDLLIKQDSANHWSLGPDSIGHNYIDGFLNMLGNMNTDDFKDTTMTSFPPPVYTITIAGTQPLTINFYKENGTPVHYIMQVSGIQQLFRYSDATVTPWFKKKTDFIPPPPQKQTPPTDTTPKDKKVKK